MPDGQVAALERRQAELLGQLSTVGAMRSGTLSRRCRRQVVPGDGAEWIWNLSGEQFPGAVEIVDIHHVRQHLSDAAKALHGAGTEEADAWTRQRRHELDDGG